MPLCRAAQGVCTASKARMGILRFSPSPNVKGNPWGVESEQQVCKRHAHMEGQPCAGSVAP